MPAPTHPKKRSLMEASKLRKALRAAGHHLQPVVQVGKEGLTDRVLAQLGEALDHHELVKLKVGTESPEDRFEVADRLAEAEGVLLAQVIGRTILAYRKHARTPRFEPLDAADRERIAEEDAARAAEAAKPARRRRRNVAKRPAPKGPPPKRFTPGRPASRKPGTKR
ncbi:MAG TPA: ribosome assembly RNA-binding protein YhbY [Anaeromyxobacteraceae bacterium]|nr:ribosome assembly RNA-binding protein YhbY [Anaeromyxobacteraceae bacterium]